MHQSVSSYGGTSATADAAALVSVQFVRVANILTTRSVEDPGQARQITSGFGRYYDVSWTPEDRIIYVSEESGSRDIWEMEADGSGRRQLTFDTQSYGPGVSPDGRRVVFASNRAGVASNRPGALHLWLMDRDGSNLSRLTDGEGEFTPHFSPDGKWIIFTSVISGMERLSKVPAGGGEAVPLLSYPSRYGVFSPDGEWIACQYLNEHAKWVVGIVPAEGGPPVKTFDIPTDTRQVLRWASDGRAVTYIGPQEKLHDIWVQPLDGGKPVQLTHFTPDQSVLFFDWSRDGRRLALLRGLSGRDVVYLSRSQ